MKELLHFLLGTICILLAYGEKLSCPLQYENYSTGNSLPESIVKFNGTQEFFGRSVDDEPGVVDNSLMLLVTEGINIVKHQEFQVLTNPLNCTVQWTDHATRNLVGLRVTNNGKNFGRSENFGVVINNKLFMVTNSQVRQTTSFNYLISFSSGISLILRDFVYETAISNSQPQLVGFDEIFNNADTIITQTIAHTDAIAESVIISSFSSKMFYITGDVHASINLPFGLGANAKVSQTYSEEETYEETISTTRSSSITSTRRVTVGPRESVQICSIMSYVEGFTSGFTATSEFRIKGWSGEKVREYLLEKDAEEYEDVEINGDSAYRRYHGNFTGSMALNTKLIVTPKDAIMSCSEYQSLEEERAKTRFLQIKGKRAVK